MSVSYLPTAAPVDLFNEADFRLGAFHARPGVREIQLDRHVERLEPRVFQVLIVLARSRNRTISRDALIALCWDGRFVSDDALNRTIGRLRQVFARDQSGSVTIETVPRLGYQLRVHESDVDPIASPSAAERPRASRTRRFPSWATGLFALVLAGLIGGTIAYVQVNPRPADPDIRLQVITSDLGAEIYPALSPSGSMIVYSAAGEGEAHHLYLRTLDDGPVEQLTSGEASETAPSWSPDGQRLAFVRTSPARCEVMIMALPRGPGRSVTTCNLRTSPSTAWLDNETLLIADRPNPAAPIALFSVDIGTGARRQVTHPAAGDWGDQLAAVSPDGRIVAFRRSSLPGVSEIYLANLESGDVRQFTRDHSTILGVAWAPDGRRLYVSTTRAGDFGLWRYDISRADRPERMVTGLRRIGRLSSDQRGRVAFEAFDLQSEIVRVTRDAQAPRTASNGESAYPDLSPDGKTLAFASDRGGKSAIWTMGVAPGSASPNRLLSQDYDYVAWPRWSPSGQRIAFLATVGGRSQLNIVAADGGRLRSVFETRDTLWSLDWISEDTLILATNGAGVWRLWKVRVTDGQATPASPPGWDSVQAGPGGRVYGTRFNTDGVWRLPASPTETPTLVAPLAPIEWRNWAISGDQVVTIRRNDAGIDLVSTPLSGGVGRVVGNPAGVANLSGLTGDAANGFYLTHGITNESDIVVIDTAPSRRLP
ncbi:MAG: winged helix-turn-helix domain-containing protein [Brevundimonas sp.]|uniref:winged helix-turn-helix domain-containing protein n=1 Tax=Brevundimonas sp. TaxID=1871086 RepID=UPI002488D716|nr:winged helix-turn-helix domain-containing protein [Brevundimonas sp.]MDI1326854.1 winged helix-turn-helix domain-containing protein [Brevundimonas sp.]